MLDGTLKTGDTAKLAVEDDKLVVTKYRLYQQNQGPSAAERGRGTFWTNAWQSPLICSYFSGMINLYQF